LREWNTIHLSNADITIMASISHFGFLPRECRYPTQEQANWYREQGGGVVIPEDLGEAPEQAYLKIPIKDVVKIFWRVKEWELIIPMGSSNIVGTLTFTDTEGNFSGTESAIVSYPDSTIEELLGSAGRVDINNPIENEEELVCNGFFNFMRFAYRPSIEVTSDVVFTSDDGEEFPSGGITNVDVQVAAGGGFSGGIELGFSFDTIWKGTGSDRTLWWPVILNFGFSIPNQSSVFENDWDGTGNDPHEGQSGHIPPIRGYLTTLPIPENFVFGVYPEEGEEPILSPYILEIHVPDSDVIEVPLYDVTPKSGISQTKFNIENFGNITIKPKSYFEYNPNDGDGPIYDSETGEQLRSFSS
jgi:hypothetical protein